MAIVASLIVLLIVISAPSNVLSNKTIKYPVILVPGDGGTRLQARINESIVPYHICYKHTSEYFELWINFVELIPYVIECFVHNMMLRYDNKTHTTSNMPGVDIRVNGWGETSTIDWLDTTHWGATKYMNTIIDVLTHLGYRSGVSLRGAPYDFRKAANEMGDLYKRFRALIEDTYSTNDNKRVILLCHSMGNQVVLYFLNRMTQEWKDKYIHAFMAVSAPFGGAVKSLRLMASGDSLGLKLFVRPLSIRPEQRSMPSTAWLMPYPQFWNASEVLVVAPERNYTVGDYREFFRDLDYMTGYRMREDTEGLTNQVTPPGVRVYCAHGVNVMTTPGVFVYNNLTWPDGQPEIIGDDGDGTVNIRSLLGCLRWRGKQKYKVDHREFPHVTHMGILHDSGFIKYLVDIVQD